jgi:3',5'-cyclic AMP phosphodiesterase CpdA
VFVLAQISDPHLGPLPDIRWRDLASKRILGYVNWHRKRGSPLGSKALRTLVGDLLASPHDHVAVTGDLINLGLPDEIDAARQWLTELGDPRDVTVVPGNHDAYLPGSVRHFEKVWRAYMSGDDNPDGPVVFPFTRRRGPIAIVGVSTAIATAPLMATGRVGGAQTERLEAELVRLGREGLFRVVLIHHPPAIGSARWHRRLIGARHFRQALQTAGAELVLHGHNHRMSVDRIDGPETPIPVIGATAASLHPHGGKPGGSYLLFRIGKVRGGFTCDMLERGARAEDRPVETLSERRLIEASRQFSGTRTQA